MKSPRNCNLTLLPPMPLRFDNDGNFEALDHYLTRLADSVALTPRTLARLIWKACGSPGKCIADMKTRSPWIGPNPRTQECISMLTACTGVENLWQGTFLHLEPSLSGVGFAHADYSSGSRKWCPNCYDEWDHSTSFEPLHWAIGFLSACPKHGVALISRCIHCGSSQLFGCEYSKRRFCRSCQLSLGHQGAHRPIDHYSSWVNLQAVAVARVASSRPSPLPADTFDRYFIRVLERWDEGEPIPTYAKRTMSVQHVPWARAERHLKPSIFHYLNLAAFHGTSVEEILVSPETAAAEPLVEGALANFSPHQARRPLVSTLYRLVSALEKLLQSDIRFIPAMFTVVTAFDVNPGYFRKRLPVECEAYSSKRQLSGKAYTKSDLRRAFGCAVALLRENAGPIPDGEQASLVTVVANRSRSSHEIARCGFRAATIVLEETR